MPSPLNEHTMALAQTFCKILTPEQLETLIWHHQQGHPVACGSSASYYLRNERG